MKKILVLNGVNLNMTGKREPEIYGNKTLEDINASLQEYARANGAELEFKQCNIEGELVNILHASYEFDGIIFNAGAYTHYSIALRDAISSISVPVLEVHMSNIHAREEFRSKSVIAPVCCGSIIGFGYKSYILALMSFLI